jgi:hypothetical protein
VAHRALVEPVDLHLNAVIAEVVEEVALKEPRRRVGDLGTAKVGMDGQAAQVGDPAASVAALEAHRACALAVDLDEEDAERFGVGAGPADLFENLVAPLRAHCGEEGLDVLVPDEADEEVRVLGPGASDRDRHAGSSWARTSNSL